MLQTKGRAFAMGKKITFKLQEFSAVIVEAIASACLVVSGVPAEQAALIGASLGGVTKGFSLSNDGSTYAILSSLKKSIVTILDSNSFELPTSCKDLLETDMLSPNNIIKFMCQSESYVPLRAQLMHVCTQDPDFDIRTFPMNEFMTMLINAFETEVLNNHELASYASYCMLRKTISSPDVHLANQQYIKSFEEPLFLHKSIENSRVNLKNLFVLPKYQLLKSTDINAQEIYADVNKNLQDQIEYFLQKSELPFLFIEGDAGSGKTTLIAWMNYLFSFGDESTLQFFSSRPLLTIRLRDLDKKDISENNSLSSAIRKYMNLSSLDELERLFPEAIMLLDGFDELCMIEGKGIDHTMLLYDLYKKNLKGFQFIVTTRPKFISYALEIPSQIMSLEHFDAEQREIWLNHYTSEEYCAQTISDAVYSYVKSIDDETDSCICDTPLTLYMLAAKKEASIFFENNWVLYHHIFWEELSETEYNKMFPDPDRKYSHDISMLRDVLYQVSEEIAYQMYKKENKSFYLSDDELSEIIRKLGNKIPVLKHANMQEIAERCYALCCYWKADSDRGVVEFLHNNIRDFFLAEKIYRDMNEVVKCIKENRTNEPGYIQIINKLCSLFQYGLLETKVVEFVYLRAKNKAEENELDFAQYEYQNQLITRIVAYLSSSNFVIDSNILTEKPIANLVQKITNILACMVQLYRNIYEAYLKKPELIRWVAESPISNNILISLFKPIFCQVPVTITSDYAITLGSRGYFNAMNFKSCDLRNIGFQGSQITIAKFSDTILCGCDFSYAILDGTDFTNADLHYASLEGASLKNCDMTGADLRGTELPDGFMSADQDEQVEHLKSLHIAGLRI